MIPPPIFFEISGRRKGNDMTEFIPAEWQKTLKERREKIGILQADFAVLAGVSVSHYREIESGRHEATASYA